MTNYVTLAQANTFLSTSGEDDIINQLIPFAMMIVNNYC
jgi:hypothetical protein